MKSFLTFDVKGSLDQHLRLYVCDYRVLCKYSISQVRPSPLKAVTTVAQECRKQLPALATVNPAAK